MEALMASNEPGPNNEAPPNRPTVTVAEVEPAETRGARFARKAHRTRLYFSAGAAVVLLIFLIALVLANTSHVKVSWVFGSSSVSLVWLVVFSAVLGLLLGMILSVLFRWRTREPRD
jgi:uncharacterized integral membrane protein